MRELKIIAPLPARALLALTALAVAAITFPWLATRAQRASKEPTVNVTSVSARPAGGGEVVSITADAPLSRAQTWQDEEGFHVVGYKWVGQFAGAPRGVKVRRVGNSLELVVQTRPGASVTVVPRANSLDLMVSGGVRASAEAEAKPAPRQEAARGQQRRADERPNASRAQGQPALRADRQLAAAAAGVAATEKLFTAQPPGRQTPANVSAQPRQPQQSQAQQANAQQSNTQQSNAQQSDAHGAQPNTQGAPSNAQPATAKGAQAAANTQAVQTAQGATAGGAPAAGASQGFPTPFGAGQGTQAATQPQQPVAQTSAMPALVSASKPMDSRTLRFSLIVVGGFLGVGLIAFLVIFIRNRGSVAEGTNVEVAEEKSGKGVKAESAEKSGGAKSPVSESEVGRSAAKAEAAGALVKREGKPAAVSAPAPPVLFGAFRVEQEIDKLLRGTPHVIEVLASRAADDRRAVETSLLKAIGSPELSEAERGRARRALEEYGFVARQSASLLLAPDAYERSSAARTLGQVKSSSSLPFLLEALYDADTVVRSEAVASLGTLGLPGAIGALLDMARRHSDVPASLVTRALSACSVDALEFDPQVDDSGLAGDWFSGEITRLEPVAQVAQLPEWLEDETLADALDRLSLDDVEARVAAAQHLSQFQVQRAVDALSAMAGGDVDASVRATAVTSLGHIDHESVFASVLIAMADESREVRAAAARALSRLSFDRADAYVRVVENADEETLQRIAEACVTAGLARQAMDRLASDDRRQAYEAFSLLTIVARGGQSEVLLHVVKGHPDLNVRLAASRLLTLQGDAEMSRRLRQIAFEGNTPEKLREAILEVCGRQEQADGGAACETNDGDKSVHPIA
ncbi:MAG TPA: HEAT repeat domain-containing protein [Pyrinomonadaceae bacterium]|jgi:HEAT repeat protein|nr:HEAT repeat domain-containing protein [Pyrinomonadaceae bacterium]